jgi:acetolactate synthase-1/2/3 large subunit
MADASSDARQTTASGAEVLIRALEAEGVDTVFGYPGGAIMPVYDALLDSKLRHILVRHEQGAALAADGYARASGRLGVCMATSGPGATNLVTGIANAYLDSVPLLAITGQVATPMMGTDAFQEVDVFGITLPIVKHSFIVRRAEDVAATVREACAIAQSGRPGPVVLDLPKDVAQARVEQRARRGSTAPGEYRQDEASELERARVLLAAAQRPVFYAGGGIGIARAEGAARCFLARTGMPSVSTLKGLGAVHPDDALHLGMLGMHGNAAANRAVQDADLLVVVGARLDDRATGKLDRFAPHARIIHVDADAAEIGKLRHADAGLTGPIEQVLAALAQPLTIDPWRAACAGLRDRYRWRYDAPGEDIYAPALLRRLSEIGGDRLVVAADVGQHQMWVAQHCRFTRVAAHLSSGGLGTMGFGLPAAIGAKLAQPDAAVVCVTGDGSFMMNVQELATLQRYGLAVKIVLLDNSSLGMVRQWQELFFDRRFSEVELSDNPDFVKVAEAFRIPAFAIERRDEVEPALQRLLAAPGSMLLHVRIDPKRNVWPLVPPGRGNGEMMQEQAA